MIKLITGQPGSGKTALTITLIKAFLDEGRTVYANGIKDLDYEALGVKCILDPLQWQDLPDGSVVVLDECYNTFPNRNPGAKVPEHVEAMARHRHRGFDFVLIAQQGLQLDPFLRGLYEEHIHVKKKFGKATALKRWSSYQSNVNGHCSDSSDWMRPDWVFKYYTSTVLNTSKLHVPKWLKMLALTVGVLLLILWFIQHRWRNKIETYEGTTPGASAAGGGTTIGAGAPGTASYKTPGDYAVAHLPRFALMPQTAPIFDGQKPTVEPQVFCMSSEAGEGADGWREASVTCLSEQGTRYDATPGEARYAARYGTPYNAYKRPPVQVAMAPQQIPRSGVQGSSPAAMAGTAASLPGMIEGDQVNGYGDIGIALKPGTAP